MVFKRDLDVQKRGVILFLYFMFWYLHGSILLTSRSQFCSTLSIVKISRAKFNVVWEIYAEHFSSQQDVDFTVWHIVPFTLFPAHPWIREQGVASDRALNPAVLSRLKQFSAMNKLKKMALRVSKSELKQPLQNYQDWYLFVMLKL